jgi:protein-S-isoprenylcysteine O-methyltransferase Ste14
MDEPRQEAVEELERRDAGRPPRFRPPFVALALVLAAWAVDWAWDAPRIVPWPWAWLGAVLIAAGVGLAAWALRLFVRMGTTHDPRERPTRLVTSGPYRVTRNPMYVAVTTVLAGIGLLTGSWPFLVFPPIGFVLLVSLFFIRREERILGAAFGAEYAEFRRRVRRWL